MNFIRNGYTFSNRGLSGSSRCAAPHCSAKKTIPASEDTSAKQPNLRTTKDWTAIGWPTNIQSETLDGEFGPAKQMKDWDDCWFLAALEVVANDSGGQNILTESIERVNVEGLDGYNVTFKGSANDTVFVLDAELKKRQNLEGGDADTRIIEIAADKFFSKEGNFKSMSVATLMRRGLNRTAAEQCFIDICRRASIQNPMTYNPMRRSCSNTVAFYMLTGRYPDIIPAGSDTSLQSSDVMRFLNQYVANVQDGASVVMSAIASPLGNGPHSNDLVIAWDAIRTAITSEGPLSPTELTFLREVEEWFFTRDDERLKEAARKLKLQPIKPKDFAKLLIQNASYMGAEQFNILRSAVREVLAGGPGYIGLAGSHHSGTIEGINPQAGTFTYNIADFPEVMHLGELSSLIREVKSGNMFLTALGQTTGQDDSDSDSDRSEHAGTSRGRRLRQLHNQVVRDGQIDQAESGPLADLMEMDAGDFRQVYDSDQNGVIEGSELKVVQKRVDRWIDHFELTPIW